MVTNADLNVLQPVAATIVDEGSFSELLSQSPVLFFGNGSGKCKEVIRHTNALFEDNVVPVARALGELAATKFANGEFEDLVHFKPLYLKEFVAKAARM